MSVLKQDVCTPVWSVDFRLGAPRMPRCGEPGTLGNVSAPEMRASLRGSLVRICFAWASVTASEFLTACGCAFGRLVSCRNGISTRVCSGQHRHAAETGNQPGLGMQRQQCQRTTWPAIVGNEIHTVLLGNFSSAELEVTAVGLIGSLAPMQVRTNSILRHWRSDTTGFEV